VILIVDQYGQIIGVIIQGVVLIPKSGFEIVPPPPGTKGLPIVSIQ
jgi:hypothetical protein